MPSLSSHLICLLCKSLNILKWNVNNTQRVVFFFGFVLWAHMCTLIPMTRACLCNSLSLFRWKSTRGGQSSGSEVLGNESHIQRSCLACYGLFAWSVLKIIGLHCWQQIWHFLCQCQNIQSDQWGRGNYMSFVWKKNSLQQDWCCCCCWKKESEPFGIIIFNYLIDLSYCLIWSEM